MPLKSVLKKKNAVVSSSSEKGSVSSVAPKVAFCLKCQETVNVKKGAYVEQLISGRKMLRGNCKVCDTSVARVVGKAVPADRIQTNKEAKDRKAAREQKSSDKLEKLSKNKKKIKKVRR